MVEKLSGEFEFLFDFRVLCTMLPTPSYTKNLELGVLVEEMINLEMPTTNQWNLIKNYSKAKYMLHQ